MANTDRTEALADNGPGEAGGPADFVAAQTALSAIDNAMRDAAATGADPAATSSSGPGEALAALQLLREVRERLAGWEAGLIEAARADGASWADLAHPLGVASRQAAERRYLRVRPGEAGSTGEERVRSTRERRAGNRSVTAWARTSAADLRRLAGEISSLTDLPPTAASAVADLNGALGDDDASALLTPLTGTRAHLRPNHPDLAARVDDVTRHTQHLRQSGTGVPDTD